MPPKVRITVEMVLDAAFALTRESGIGSVNARAIAKRLNCSTQPVLYNFSSMDDLRREIYRRAEAYQTAFIMTPQESEPSVLSIGEAYVRFAAEEKHLFRLLFQSNHFEKQTLEDVVEDESVQPLIDTLMQRNHVTRRQAKDDFTARFLMVHGMASMLANNAMIYDKQTIIRLLSQQFG